MIKNKAKSIIFGTVITSLLLIAGLVPAAAVHAATTSAVIISAPDVVMPGEQFTVEVIIQPDTPIAGGQFNLAYDPSLVTVNSVAEGPFLSQTGADTFFRQGTIDNTNGIVEGVAGAIITSGVTVSGSGTFAIITMTAGAVRGGCDLALSNVVIANADGVPVPVSVSGSYIAIGTNQSPALTAIGDQTANKGELLSFTVTATDPDGDTLTYSASNLPKGASFDPASHVFTWTPRGNQVGVFSGIRFTVSDGTLSDSQSITITVSSSINDNNGVGKGKKPLKK